MPSLQPQGTPIQLNVNAGGASTLVPLAGGGFAAVYKVRGGPDVFRLFDGNYSPTGGEIAITYQDAIVPSATALSDGRFLVAWTQADLTVRASIWNADGTISNTAFQLGAASDQTVGISAPKVVATANGGFLAMWQDNGTVPVPGAGGTASVATPLILQWFDSTGTAVGDPVVVAKPAIPGVALIDFSDYQVTVLPNGQAVLAVQVTTHQINADGNPTDPVTSIWTSVNGQPFVLLAGGDATYTYVNPQVAALAGGGYVVTYDFVNPSSVGTTNPDSNWTTGGTVFTDHGTHHQFAIGTTITTTPNGQLSINPSVITPLPDGGFVVSFEPLASPLGSGYIIDAQRFDAFGQALGPVVLTTPQGFQPGLGTASDGTVLNTFQVGGNIFLASYTVQGTPSGIEPEGTSFGFNSVVSANSPGVSVLSNGSFVVVYQGFGGGDGESDPSRKAYFQIYDANRQPVGNEIRISNNASQPVVAAQANGTFLVVWTTGGTIRGQLYNNNGTKSGAALTLATNNEHPFVNPGVVATTDGGYLVAYETDLQDTTGSHRLTIQRFSGTGAAQGTALSQIYAPTNPLTPPRITALEALLFGSAAVLGQGNQIYVNIFAGSASLGGSAGLADQATLTGAAGVADLTAANPILVAGAVEDGTIRRASQIAALGNGTIVVAWDELPPNGATWRVAGQVMTAAGQVVGSPFRIVTSLPASSTAGELSLSALRDGGFLVTYDSGNGSLAGQRFDGGAKAVGDPTLLTAAADTGAVTTVLADGSVLVTTTATTAAGVFQVSGGVFAVTEIAMNWAAAAGGDLGTPGNWDIKAAPDGSHAMTFSSAGGGALTGTATAATAAFSGPGAWIVNGGTVNLTVGLADQGQLTLNGGTLAAAGTATVGAAAGAALALAGGARTTVQGTAIGEAATDSGTLTASGGALWSATGAGITVGGAGTGGLVASNAAVASAGTVTLGRDAGASGSAAVSGATGQLAAAGALIVGGAGTGNLAVTAGGAVSAASLDAGAAAGGSGIISVVGANSALNIGGLATIGDFGPSTLSLLNGGTFHAGNLNIGMGAASGAVILGGAATAFHIDNNMTIGHNGVFSVGAGVKVFIVGDFANAGALNLGDGANIDPTTVTNSARAGAGGGASISGTTRITNNSTYYAGEDKNGSFILNTPSLTGTGVLEIGTALNAGAPGNLVLNAGVVDASQSVSFTGPNAILTLGTGATPGSAAIAGFHAVIGQFQAGDTIVVDTTAAAHFALNGAVVSVVDDGTGATEGSLTFANAALASLAATTPGALVDPGVPCFAAGTRIATTRGPVSVESLRAGDRVCTVLGGDTAEVVWVGHRAVDCRRHPDPAKVWPIHVAAGAFGRDAPATDLVLSPDHAVYVDEVLIPVRLLVNGRTIRQVLTDRVVYHHVELERHDILLANGLPAESYLDTGDRSRFANGGGVLTLHPDFSARTWETSGCAPLVLTGSVLESVRARLAARKLPRKRRMRETFVPGTTWPQ